MDSSRRPPHYYGLPSKAPRRTTRDSSPNQEPAHLPRHRHAPHSQSPQRRHQPSPTPIAQPPRRVLKRPHERFGTTDYAAPRPVVRMVDNDPYEEFADPVEQRRHARSTPQPVQHPRRRTRARKRIPLWRIAKRIAAVLLLVAIGEGVFAALTSPQFNVKSVRTPNNLKTTPMLTVQAVSDRLVGKNWILVRTAKAAKALETLPSVRHAHFARVWNWPPRLALIIEERQPFAKIGRDGQWWVVDHEGVPFRLATAEDSEMNAITGPAFQPKLGQPLPVKTWQPVLQFADALEKDAQQSQRWALRRIYFDRDGNAALRLADAEHHAMLLRLGPDRWNEKLVRARQALTYFASTGRDPEILDLRSYSRPLWRPRLASAATENPAPRTLAPADAPGRSDTADTVLPNAMAGVAPKAVMPPAPPNTH